MTIGTGMLVREQPDTGGRVAVEFPQLGQREGKDAQAQAIHWHNKISSGLFYLFRLPLGPMTFYAVEMRQYREYINSET